MILFNIRHSATTFCAAFLALTSGLPLHAADSATFTLEVRTLTPLSSRHNPDLQIEAELIRPLTQDREILMPAHSRLFGHIRQVRSVGIGLRRERASVEIEFTSWETPAGTHEPLDATPLLIDNAREQVDSHGRIQGILAASNPLGIARGLWFRPGLRLLRTPAGLGGASWAHLALGPAGASGMLGARLLLTRLPDPEIDLPAGTEMTLQVHCAAVKHSWGTLPAPIQPSDSLTDFLAERPTAILKADGNPVADVINVALMGSLNQVQTAFLAAGWSRTDELNGKSFKQTYRAFTQRQGYSEAPVSKLYYQDRLPDLVFQKSLNSIAKRHHVRLWKVGGPAGEEIWLGAATHDVTVGFNSKNFGLLHKIDENVDHERSKLSGDLEFAGATQTTVLLPREFALDAGTQTDRALALMILQAPTPTTQLAQTFLPKAPRMQRFLRRIILEGRQYLFRDNPYYLAFATARKLVRKSEGAFTMAWQEIEALPQVIAPSILPGDISE